MGVWRGLIERWRALPSWTRALSGIALSCLLFGLGTAVVLPIAVEREARSRAEARGFRIEVGSVRLGFARVWLRDAVLTDPALPASRAKFDAIELRPSLGSGVVILVHGGSVRLVGSEAALRERWRSLRGTPKESSAATRGSGRQLSVEGLSLQWLDPTGRRLAAWGARLRQDRGETRAAFSADLLRAVTQRSVWEARSVEVELQRGPSASERSLVRADAAQLAVRVELAGAPEKVPSGVPGGKTPGRGPVSNASAVVPAPAGHGAAPAFAVANKLAGEDESSVDVLSLLSGNELARLTDEGFRSSVVALSLEVHRHREALRIGPSRFTAAREGKVLVVGMTPHAVGAALSTPLNLRARLPLEAGAAEVELSGGPLSLATLGVREGDFGLVSVRNALLEADAHIVLRADRTLEINSKGSLENLHLRRAALSPRELSAIRLGWRMSGTGSMSGLDWALRDAELSLGQVRAEISGSVSQKVEQTKASVHVEVPLTSCSELLSAVPRGMIPLVEGVRMNGTFSLKGGLEFDSAKLDATRVNLQVINQCRIAEYPAAISPSRFRERWLREVKAPDGSPMMIESGPGSANWVSYEDISPYMETAILVCEDGGFFAHHGLDYQAIENSIRMNLQAGKFLRGASTVSMQLAKNLYLGKEKTLSRKLQEAMLTLLLEQELSKHELLELYLNVIEFGPGIYGIRQAAQYYFNEEPHDLSLGQSLYLASILPTPDTQHFLPDGRVSDGWSRYLRKLMQVAQKRRRISDDELAAGLAEQVAFRRPNLLGTGLSPTDESEEEEPALAEP